jgi:dsRNA-specific ribonuclease
LAVVSASLGLPYCLNHMSESLGNAMVTWLESFNARNEQVNQLMASSEAKDFDTLVFWNQLVFAPKPLGDVVESIIGAVFVDSGFNLDAVKEVLDTIIFRPWWPRFGSFVHEQGLSTKHPAIELIDQMCELKCHQLVSETILTNSGLYQLKYTLHGREIARCKMETQRDVKKAAAFAALEFIRSNMEQVREKCDCEEEEVEMAD